MSGWATRRFWTEAHAERCEGGFTVLLDARPVRTPAKAPLVVPSRAMAEAIAAEWQAQTGKIDPETMPVTRAANSAIDKVRIQFDEVAGLLAEYGDSDLLCYRATEPAELIARQAEAWDRVLDWAARALGARLRVARGVIHVPQDAEALGRLAGRVTAFGPFELTALHDLVAISGSLVLALAVVDGHLSVEEAWRLSRIDETWQAELWGRDDEAERAESVRHAGFVQADRFFQLCRPDGPASERALA